MKMIINAQFVFKTMSNKIKQLNFHAQLNINFIKPAELPGYNNIRKLAQTVDMNLMKYNDFICINYLVLKYLFNNIFLLFFINVLLYKIIYCFK